MVLLTSSRVLINFAGTNDIKGWNLLTPCSALLGKKMTSLDYCLKLATLMQSLVIVKFDILLCSSVCLNKPSTLFLCICIFSYRLLAVDHGLVSFVDVTLNSWPVVLITNPKNALFLAEGHEPTSLIQHSTHVR